MSTDLVLTDDALDAAASLLDGASTGLGGAQAGTLSAAVAGFRFESVTGIADVVRDFLDALDAATAQLRDVSEAGREATVAMRAESGTIDRELANAFERVPERA